MVPGPPSRTHWLSIETLATGAFVLIALTIVRPINIAVVVAATVVLVASRLAPALRAQARAVQTWCLWACGIAIGAGLLADGGFDTYTVMVVALAPLIAALVAILLWSDLDAKRMRWIGTGLLLMMVGVVAATWIVWVERPDIDVLNLHVSAAEQLTSGGNPYAGARAPDTGPAALPGDEVVGYPYPPATMLPFVASQWLFGDPRWAGVIAVAAAIVIVVRPWLAVSGDRSRALLAVGLAIVVQPALGYVLNQGWTETLALPMIAGVGVLWRKHPSAAAALLGLTLGLKQYWIVVLPLLIVWHDEFRWRRLAIAGGVAGLSLLPAFVADPRFGWQSLVVDLVSLPSRTDSLGLAGLGWNIPYVVVLVLVVAVAGWMGWPGGSSARFQLAIGATLATAFLLGTQAFVNYWLLVASIAMLALAVDVVDAPTESAPLVELGAGSVR